MIAGVGGLVVAGELRRDRLSRKRSSCVPQRRQAAGRQRQLHARSMPIVPAGTALAGLVEDPHVVARHRHGRRAVLDRQHAEARPDCRRSPSRSRSATSDRSPARRACSSAHSTVSGSARSPARNSVRNFDRSYCGDELALRVFLLDGAERGRRGEQRDHACARRSRARRRRHRACRPACPRRGSWCSRAAAAHRRCRNGRPPSRRRRPPRTPRRARRRRWFFIDQCSATMWPPLSRTTPLGWPVVPDV